MRRIIRSAAQSFMILNYGMKYIRFNKSRSTKRTSTEQNKYVFLVPITRNSVERSISLPHTKFLRYWYQCTYEVQLLGR